MEDNDKREPRRDAENIQTHYNSKSRHVDFNALMAELWARRADAREALREGDIADSENPQS